MLVGDAAHGMPPLAAQGANQGLEDAAVITTLIDNLAKNNSWNDLEAITKAFLKYENLRRPILVRVQEATLSPFSALSNEVRQTYNQEIYNRNLEEIMSALVLEKV